LDVSAVGAEADSDRVNLLLKELEGKDILEVIAAGKEKFASVPSGGGGGVVVSSGGGGAAAAPAAEEVKEEKKEEPKEESDDVSGAVNVDL
jgi:large subunit ribosomal protein LP2